MASVSGWVWDACGLLNLMATERTGSILPCFGVPSFVVREVRSGEVFTLRPLPEEDPTGKLLLVEMASLFATGVLQEVEMSAIEQATFVAFAATLDDGEARTAAVAVHRGFGVVTDDRVALRLLGAHSPLIPTLQTPDWVKLWAEEETVSPEILSNVLRRIELCAHFFPRRAHPLKSWWDSHRAGI